MSDAYAFDRLPLDDIRPGTTVLITGPRHEGARELGLRLLAGPAGEGTVVVTTNQRAERVAEDCERVGIRVSGDRTAILDCVGEEDDDIPARVLPVSGPADLTGIGMRFSDVYVDFNGDGIERVRTGLFSLSTLLSFGDLRTVSRFVHTLVGRVDTVGGLGAFLLDPASHDEQVIRTLSQFCGGRIEVRNADGGPELRARGVPDQPDGWLPFDRSPR